MVRDGNSYKETTSSRPADTIPIFYGPKKILRKILPMNLLRSLGIIDRLEILENNGYKITYFEVIDLSTSASGTITFPTTSSLILDGFEGNAVLSKLNANGAPNGDSVDDPALSAIPITISLDSAGNYTASNTTTTPAAIIYQISINGSDRNNLNESQVIDYFEENYAIKVLGNDTTPGYLVSKVISLDTSIGLSVDIDIPTGSQRLNLQANSSILKTTIESTIDPTITDDSNDGYLNGLLWLNTTTDELFYLADNTAGAAVWISLSSLTGGGIAPIIAIVDPVVGDDTTQGYEQGQIWVNTANSTIYINEDVSIGAAIWRQIWPSTGGLTGSNKGDIFVWDGSALQELPVGADTQTLIANSATLTGLEWVTNQSGVQLGGAENVDGTVTGDHLLYTVPAGKETITVTVSIRLKTISGTGAVPKVSVGTNSPDYDNIVLNTQLAGLEVINDGYSFIVQGTFRVAQAGEGIYLRVNNASTFTDYEFCVDFIGFNN